MVLRNLLICEEPKNEIEAGLKRMYLKRVQEMLKKTLSLDTIFNVFDEVFHGLSKVNLTSESLYSFYESVLTVTSYYQHSQAGRGNLIAKLLEEFGTTDKMEFEFSLLKLPQLLKQNITLAETELTKQKFDIVNKSGNNIVFCELKMKVYSGCTAGRVEMMEKFNKFTKLIISNETFRTCLKNAGINNVFLVGGILFDIKGEPATLYNDKEWGICYNGLIRGKNDVIKTLTDNKIPHKLDDEKKLDKAFIIEIKIDDIKLFIIAVYGNEVINSLFLGKQKFNLEFFKSLLEKMLFDDLWLGQLITISERSLLDQNFKKFRRLNNYVLSIFHSDEVLKEIRNFQRNKDINTLKSITNKVIDFVKQFDKNLLSISPIPAQLIFSITGDTYDLADYISDIIQFLSCKEVTDILNTTIDELYK